MTKPIKPRPIGRPAVHARQRKRTLPLRVPLTVAQFLVDELTEWSTRTEREPRTWRLREQVHAFAGEPGAMIQIPLTLPQDLRDLADKMIRARVRAISKSGVATETLVNSISAAFHREALGEGQEQADKQSRAWRAIREEIFTRTTTPNLSEIACEVYRLGLTRLAERIEKSARRDLASVT